ncbi:MAG TPA: site-specific integrase [Chryseolinea sp.]|nr:site-specific integrase [Chryseolinea sp.]
MKVTLRNKPISKGRRTLYLDFYPPIINPETGKPTRREFLGLYVFAKPVGEIEREHNKETKILADSICAQRQLKVQAGNYGFLKTQQNINFANYFKNLCEQRKTSIGNYDSWLSSSQHFSQFTKEQCPMETLSEKLVEGFRDHLLQANSLRNTKNTARLSQNAAHSYFNKFRAAVGYAFRENLIDSNPCLKVKSIKQTETDRAYLSLEELNKLSKTECDLPDLKRAALFSALTGLRWVDIKNLSWSQIHFSEASGYTLHFRQRKTGGFEVHNISEQAYSILGRQPIGENSIFPTLEYSAWMLMKLKDWLTLATIYKKITFHNFRHTYATLQLSQGTDIYTLSKMLGHRNVKTTQAYTKVVDKLKVEAANRIKLDM